MIINKQQRNANFDQNLVVKTWLPWQQGMAYQYENYTIMLLDKFKNILKAKQNLLK